MLVDNANLMMAYFTTPYFKQSNETKNLFPALFALLLVGLAPRVSAQQVSMAQEWNETLLFSITNDFARPPVHARNLLHTSIAMYDAWAAYDDAAEPYLLGRTRGTHTSPFSGVSIPDSPEEIEMARNEAISFAMYRIIQHRFQNAPGAFTIFSHINNKMDQLGYNRFNTSTAYVAGGPAELGNYIAQQIINFGLTDGSNETANHGNTFYQPVNGNILPEQPGPGDISDPNRWQAISLSVTIDQSGNVISDPPHLAPEWGNVLPYAMTSDQLSVLERDGHSWKVYYDPGHPVYLDLNNPGCEDDLYKWNFMMVSVWQSHLDPNDDTIWDVSPATIGNVPVLPSNYEDYESFYDFFNGGTPNGELGYAVNPVTGEPYEPQLVRRGDYGRVLAEFWADGLDSETPPGHWYKIYNEIRQHPMWEDRWMGEGPELSQLEMDVRSYLTIGGAMHDAAIVAWGIKGYYDYVRPVSAIRYMCEMGQCSDPMLPNYHPAGAPLMPGYVELVEPGDPLAGSMSEHVGKIKLYTWRGPEYITDPETTFAGVGWILGENWWPYQRPTFVTPPFAGFISGHSTYSRTAAEVFTLITGSEYFPGGMSNFIAAQNEFLEFEAGPSETVILQWATYRDASDQCSLSRIWGGIHPPVDDIPGRLIGQELGPQVVQYTNEQIFGSDRPLIESVEVSTPVINIESIGSTVTTIITFDRQMNVNIVPAITFMVQDPLAQGALSVTDVGWISSTEYRIQYIVEESNTELLNVHLRIAAAQDINGTVQNVRLFSRPLIVDTRRPELEAVTPGTALINDQVANDGTLVVTFEFSESCGTLTAPEIELLGNNDLIGVLTYNEAMSEWVNDNVFSAVFAVTDTDVEIESVGFSISAVTDVNGNELIETEELDVIAIDTRNPIIELAEANNALLNTSSVGSNAITLTFEFDEPMITTNPVTISFPNENPLGSVLTFNMFTSGWNNPQSYTASYNQQTSAVELNSINTQLAGVTDLAGNAPIVASFPDLFSIDTKRPQVTEVSPSNPVVADADVNDGSFSVDIAFDEPMSQAQLLLVQLSGAPNINASLSYNPVASAWLNDATFRAVFNASDQNVEIGPIQLAVTFGADLAGNTQTPYNLVEWANIDTRNPEILSIFANTYTVNSSNIGEGGFSILIIFDEAMNTGEEPALVFFTDENVDDALETNENLSGWINTFTYQAWFDVFEAELVAENVGVGITNVTDLAGNNLVTAQFSDFFDIDLTPVSVAENRDHAAFMLYPNPVRSGAAIWMSLREGLTSAIVEVVGLDGRVVYRVEHPMLNPGLHHVELPNLASGVYLTSVRTTDVRWVQKMIVTD